MRVLFAPGQVAGQVPDQAPDEPFAREKSPAARWAWGRAPRRRTPARAPIPRRLPVLTWRRPAIVWTPVALVLALGWPAMALREAPGLAQMALTVGAVTFAICLISLGATWLLRRPPRTRRTVVSHVVVAGMIASAAAPFIFISILGALAVSERADAPGVDMGMGYAMAPLALILGLPLALFAGMVFAFVALVKPPRTKPRAPDSFEGEIVVYERGRDVERVR